MFWSCFSEPGHQLDRLANRLLKQVKPQAPWRAADSVDKATWRRHSRAACWWARPAFLTKAFRLGAGGPPQGSSLLHLLLATPDAADPPTPGRWPTAHGQ